MSTMPIVPIMPMFWKVLSRVIHGVTFGSIGMIGMIGMVPLGIAPSGQALGACGQWQAARCRTGGPVVSAYKRLTRRGIDR